MSFGTNPNRALSDTSQANALRAVLLDLVGELRGRSTSGLNISLASKLDRDLGIDSLGRTELVMRIERAFRVHLPISVMAEANTVGDLLRALERATSGLALLDSHVVADFPKPETLAVTPAIEVNTLVEALEWHVARNPDRVHLTVLQDENIVLSTITYADLAKSARDIAGGFDCSRRGAWRSGRPYVAHQRGFLHGFLRHPLQWRCTGADLPADATVAA